MAEDSSKNIAPEKNAQPAGAPPASAPTPVQASPKVSVSAAVKGAMKLRAQDLVKSGAQGTFFSTLKQINSKDGPTRYMARVFLLSLIAMALVFYGVFRLYQLSHLQTNPAGSVSEHLGQFLAKEAEESKFDLKELDLGAFTIELKPDASGAKPGPGVRNLADVQIVLECDNDETRSFIVENQIQARNQVTNILTPLDRDYLVAKEGRDKLKKLLIRGLNEWLPQGKIKDIFFPRLIVN